MYLELLIEDTVTGRQGDCYILRFWRIWPSVARDCKRDIYSRFLHLARHTQLQFLYIIVILTYHLYTFNRLLLHLIIVYPLLVCILLLLYVYICVCFLLYCLVSWYCSCRVFFRLRSAPLQYPTILIINR
jgi:hypothetical protein